MPRQTINYQQHFEIDATARRRGNQNQENPTASPATTPFTNDDAGGQADEELIDPERLTGEESGLGDEDEEEDEDVLNDFGMPGDLDGTNGHLQPNAIEAPMEIEAPFDAGALGLKEIGNLASWTVSSSKPGCGVAALRDDDTSLFWQSDGPQPHYLNIHFAKFAKIRAIRIYLDFEADESYTPTKIQLLAGTGYHDLITFSDLAFTQPKGWIDVSLAHVGGGDDGKTLRAFLVQVKVVENHQNGKDTHIRGLKIYAADERAEHADMDVLNEKDNIYNDEGMLARLISNKSTQWCMTEPDWMGEPELR